MFPDSIRTGVNATLDNVFAGCQESEASPAIDAPELLHRLARSGGDDKVSLLAPAPLSNIARALHGSRELRDHVEAAFVMGAAGIPYMAMVLFWKNSIGMTRGLDAARGARSRARLTSGDHRD